MKQYGLPYMGSKSKIAEWIVNCLPKGGTLYDVFCGGCAITDCAMQQHRYSEYVANDLVPSAEMFNKAIHGGFKDEKEWISREEYKKRYKTDMYVKQCWSFGNQGEDNYLYGKEIEPWKKALHYARVFGDTSLFKEMGIDTDGSRADITKHHYEYKEKYIEWYLKNVMGVVNVDFKELRNNTGKKIKEQKEELRQYLVSCLKESGLRASDVNKRLGTQMSGHYFGKSQWAFPTREEYGKMREFMPTLKPYDEVYGYSWLLQSLQRLQSLESLQRLSLNHAVDNLIMMCGNYYDVPITAKTGVIYCDPPYRDTASYLDMEGNKSIDIFDYERFYDWCEHQTLPVFISEYNMPKNRFRRIATFAKNSLLSSQGASFNEDKYESLWVPINQKTEETTYNFIQTKLF